MIIDRYTHISFDLDGTLVHTVPEYRYGLVPVVVGQLGGSIEEKRHIDQFWFEGDRDTTIRVCFGLEPDAFWDTFRSMDTPEERSRHTRAYDDAERALRKVSEAGKKASILTGAPEWIAKMEIEKLNSAPHDFYLSLTSAGFGQKPDPESFHFALAKLGMAAHETLYVGNSSEDARYAKNAGVDFVYLERKEHEFDPKEYPIATIHSPDELFA